MRDQYKGKLWTQSSRSIAAVFSPSKKLENFYRSINRKVASSDVKDEETKMGFGDFMRWLLIAAIVIAIVFFLGGQALQIGKNWE